MGLTAFNRRRREAGDAEAKLKADQETEAEAKLKANQETEAAVSADVETAAKKTSGKSKMPEPVVEQIHDPNS